MVSRVQRLVYSCSCRTIFGSALNKSNFNSNFWKPKANVPEDKIALFTDTNAFVTYGDLRELSLKLRDSVLCTAADLFEAKHNHSPVNCSATRAWDVAERFKYQPRVGVLSEASENFVIALLAAWLCGAIAVPLCHTYPPEELEYILRDCTVSLLLCSREQSDSAQQLSHQTGIPRLCVEECTSRTFHQDNETPSTNVDLESQHAALVLYTSGTTGRPKGVLSTHANLRWDRSLAVFCFTPH